MMQGVEDKINNEIREKGSDKNPIPRVPPVTRAVIPVRDHLCPPLLLCVSTAAAAAILYYSLSFLHSIKTLTNAFSFDGYLCWSTNKQIQLLFFSSSKWMHVQYNCTRIF